MNNKSKYALFLTFCLLSSSRDSISEFLFKGENNQLSPIYVLFIFSIFTQIAALFNIFFLKNERAGFVNLIAKNGYKEILALNFFTLGAFLMYFLAISSPVGAAVNSLIDYGTAPFFTAIIGGFLLKQNISKDFYINSTICAVGVYIIFKNSIINIENQMIIQLIIGFFCALASSIFSAVYRIYFKRLLNIGLSKSLIIFSRLLGLSLVSGFIILMNPQLWNQEALIMVIFVGILGFSVPLFISLYVLQRVSIEHFSILLFCLPLVTALETMGLGYYKITWEFLLGATLILIGILRFEQTKYLN